MTPQST